MMLNSDHYGVTWAEGTATFSALAKLLWGRIMALSTSLLNAVSGALALALLLSTLQAAFPKRLNISRIGGSDFMQTAILVLGSIAATMLYYAVSGWIGST